MTFFDANPEWSDPEDLYVNCAIEAGNSPAVIWQFGGKAGLLSVTEARSRALSLFDAAAIAHSEAAIVKGIRSTFEDKPKGFGKTNPKKSEEALEVSGKTLLLMRQFRPPLPEAIEVIYGHNTQQPLIVIHAGWYGEKMQLTPEQIQNHAMNLLGASEAAETDGFFYRFFQEKLDIEPDETQALIQEFGVFRNRNRLEDLFGGGSSTP